MAETLHSPAETNTTSFEESTNDALALGNSGGDASIFTAARNIVDASPSLAPVVTTSERIAQSERPAPTTENTDRRVSTPARLLAGAAATVAVAGGALGLNAEQGGNYTPDLGNHDPSIKSITLEEDARVRHDPHTGSESNFTLIKELDEVRTIETPGGVRVLEGTDNGTWYGFSPTDIPNVDAKADKDGIIWVNEATVDSIDRTGSSE